MMLGPKKYWRQSGESSIADASDWWRLNIHALQISDFASDVSAAMHCNVKRTTGKSHTETVFGLLLNASFLKTRLHHSNLTNNIRVSDLMGGRLYLINKLEV